MNGEVHQLVSDVRRGDAIGNTVLRTRTALRLLGYRSEIFRETCAAELAGETYPVEEYLKISSPERHLLFHYSIGSDLNRMAYALPDRIILSYHNITPPEYYLGIHDHLVGQLYHGRKQLGCFADRCVLAVGDTEYNRRELEAMGFPRTGVLPLALDFEHLDIEPDPIVKKAYSDHLYNFLFVGRIVPNKRIEDLIKLYAHYKKYVSHDCRLLIVGSWLGFERYRDQLLRLLAEIDLPHVVMPGAVDLRKLVAFYRTADVFCTLSEHEGFCAPLLEAMHFDVPVLARAAAAIPETMDGAGVLLQELNYAEAAEMLKMLAAPGLFRERVIEGQRERLARFRAVDVEERIAGVLKAAGDFSPQRAQRTQREKGDEGG
jgi:glycosyltransferase involved in cell wall biosynthesis